MYEKAPASLKKLVSSSSFGPSVDPKYEVTSGSTAAEEMHFKDPTKELEDMIDVLFCKMYPHVTNMFLFSLFLMAPVGVHTLATYARIIDLGTLPPTFAPTPAP